jgi:hypothetical protein
MSLPSTRPQRPSARRAAARHAAAAHPDAKGGSQSAATSSGGQAANGTAPASAAQNAPTGAKQAARRRASTVAEPPVPRQGFESESEIEPGVPVQPPSPPELAASVAELLGELAQSGLATGGRLLRDALGRLPGV